MKKILFSLIAGMFFSIVSYAQTFESVHESIHETINDNTYTAISYWDNWQGHYSGTNFEMDYSFTEDGYFTYSITVYPGVFVGNTPGAYNEIGVTLSDDYNQVEYTDWSNPVGVNAGNVVKSGSFYVGATTYSRSFLFFVEYMAGDNNSYKDGYVDGSCTIHW